jgi:hypothetical protein
LYYFVYSLSSNNQIIVFSLLRATSATDPDGNSKVTMVP